jgi:23S rRNA (adenine2030-N6)-methyltransferase
LAHIQDRLQIALKMMRQQDRAIFCELRPDAAIKLKRECKLDVRVKALQIDGYSALKAFVPPKERRGLVSIDPPFEDKVMNLKLIFIV